MLVIHNAKIHNINTARISATALAIDQDRVIAIGMDDEILSSFSRAARYNAGGRILLPGLTDAHIHLEGYAFSRQKVDCETQTQSECLQRVAVRVHNAAAGEWVLGHGWNQNNWGEGYGSKDLLDEIAPLNPVYLTHKSLHSGWANSSALHLAGIDRNTPDPAGGKIGHQQNGEPDGILYESAMSLVEMMIPEPGPQQAARAIKDIQPHLWKMGLTGVHDFDGSSCFAALQLLHQAKELKLRVIKSIPLEKLPDAIGLGLRTGFGDDVLRIGSVKLFADGALGPHTAAMFQPYEDDPTNRGVLMLDAGQLFEIGRQAVRNGISLAIHAIGDRANHEVLDAYAQLRELERHENIHNPLPLKHRVEHVQVLLPDDIHRFHDLDIIASMQPIHATSDMLMADQFWGRRSAFAYTWRDQLSHHGTVIFGSDAPVESPNPFWGIHAAVTRRRADGTPSPDGWYPQQRLNFAEALQAYTSGPASAAGLDDRLGRLEPGYLADMILLDTDPFTCPPDELLSIHSLATMVGGEWVYREIG